MKSRRLTSSSSSGQEEWHLSEFFSAIAAILGVGFISKPETLHLGPWRSGASNLGFPVPKGEGFQMGMRQNLLLPYLGGITIHEVAILGYLGDQGFDS